MWAVDGYSKPNNYIADNISDVQNLPKTVDVLSGATCLVMEDSSVYMLGVEGTNPEDRVWKKI